jgi:hypothetical protein
MNVRSGMWLNRSHSFERMATTNRLEVDEKLIGWTVSKNRQLRERLWLRASCGIVARLDASADTHEEARAGPSNRNPAAPIGRPKEFCHYHSLAIRCQQA